MIIAFIGRYIFHSKDVLRKQEQVLNYLEKTVGDKPCEFYLGFYSVFDIFSRRCCIRYRATHPNAKLINVVGYPKKIYGRGLFDAEIYPLVENVPPYLAIQRRNAWMAEHADIIITYNISVCGFMKDLLDSAARANKTIVNLVYEY